MNALPGLRKLLCVDPFIHYPDHTATLNPNKKKFYHADFDKVHDVFKTRMEPFSERYMLLKMFSSEAVNCIDDEMLDFVFIDGNHAYDYVKQDILLWRPKVKKGGVLSGHDYRVKGHKGNFGVTKAVREIFGTNYEFKRFVWWHIP
jgi:hypothetical protein